MITFINSLLSFSVLFLCQTWLRWSMAVLYSEPGEEWDCGYLASDTINCCLAMNKSSDKQYKSSVTPLTSLWMWTSLLLTVQVFGHTVNCSLDVNKSSVECTSLRSHVNCCLDVNKSSVDYMSLLMPLTAVWMWTSLHLRVQVFAHTFTVWMWTSLQLTVQVLAHTINCCLDVNKSSVDCTSLC